MDTARLLIGDSTRGYDSASVTVTKQGKYRLIEGTINGRKTLLRAAVANINRGEMQVLTSAGDSIPVYLQRRP